MVKTDLLFKGKIQKFMEDLKILKSKSNINDNIQSMQNNDIGEIRRNIIFPKSCMNFWICPLSRSVITIINIR